MLSERFIVKTSPVAKEKNVVFWKNYRVTVLTDRLFRLERSERGVFRDAATQSVWFRDMPEQEFSVELGEKRAVITAAGFKLILREKREDCLVEVGGKLKRIENAGNLKGTYRTLDQCNGDDFIKEPYNPTPSHKVELENGVCSRSGVALFHDENSLTLSENGEIIAEKGDGTDEYVFVYGNDYRGAVRALYLITGKTPLVPRFALGNWWSRYFAYTDEEYLRVLNRFEEREVPLTVATIDMDWHYSNNLDAQKKITEQGRNTPFYGGANGWTGYSWNKELFPDPQAFLKEISQRGLKITLNLHPADGIRWWEDCYEEMANAMGMDASTLEKIPFDIANPKFIENYFSVVHKPHERDGVAFWWIDWQQGTTSGMEGLDPLWSLNHYHYLDNAADTQTPLILSRYAGVGSHRYPLGFSGDTHVTWKTLGYLPYFTATASNVGYTWWSHDIGGHMQGEKSDELYTRHVQFGVLSPINRLHGSSELTMSKEPWRYLNGAGAVAENWLRFRHRLIPWLYTQARRTSEEGLAIVEPVYYEWDQREAYERKSEYLFGGDMLVAPVTAKRFKDGYARTRVWIPEGRWTDIFTGDKYVSPVGGVTKTLLRTLENVPVLMRAGGVLPLSADKGNSVDNPEKLEVWAYSGNGGFTLYEDGRENGKQGEFFTGFKMALSETDGACLQTLRISSRGESSVVPEGRRIRVLFKDIPGGAVTVRKDGVEVPLKKLVLDCAAAEFAFEAGCEYTVEVEFSVAGELEELKARALEILLCAEGVNDEKGALRAKLFETDSVEAFLKTVEASGLNAGVKLRLKETVGEK
ncbi:MAG: alpha-xylosidase [Clostridia bacterium]|nr:alpha-xylosidase [Clostridia bacterium]